MPLLAEAASGLELVKDLGPIGAPVIAILILWMVIIRPMRTEDREEREKMRAEARADVLAFREEQKQERSQWISTLTKFEGVMNTALARVSDEVRQTRREVHELRGTRRNQDEVPQRDQDDDGN